MKVSPVRHPLESLGLVRIERGDIRVERLSQRTDPTVPFPHRHDFFQLLWMQRGSGIHEIDFQRHQVAAHQFYLMKPGQVHRWNLSANAEGIIIEFSSESLPEVKVGSSLESILLQLPDLVSVKNGKAFESKVLEMLEEFDLRKPGYAVILQAYLSILISELSRMTKVKGAVEIEADAMISRFQRMVEEHFKDQHGLEFYSGKLKLSPRALTMRTTRHLEKSGRDVIFDRLILEAKRMLAYTDQSISTIGYDLGFEDANHFSRFFKKQSGLTAQEFRTKSRTHGKGRGE